MFCIQPQCEVTSLAYEKKSNLKNERCSILIVFSCGKGVAQIFDNKTVNIHDALNFGPYFGSHRKRVVKDERKNDTLRYKMVFIELFLF